MAWVVIAPLACWVVLTLADARVATAWRPPGAGGDGSDCPADTFMDLSTVDGAGPGYPRPYVLADCTGDVMTVRSNGVPHYRFVSVTPNGLREPQHTFRIPRRPQRQARPTRVPKLGPVAVAINGAPIYGPNEGPHPDPWGDPVYNGIMDTCMGHTAHRGDYHYHALLMQCFFENLPEAGAPDPVVGWSFDGYPIYGPRGCVDADCTAVVEFKSSWVRTGDPSTNAWENHQYRARSGVEYLDECNGRVGPDGTYRYHATRDFPYVLGCYRGVALRPLRSNDGRGRRGRRPPPPHVGGRPPGGRF